LQIEQAHAVAGARRQIHIVQIDADRRSLIGIILIGDADAAQREIGLGAAIGAVDLEVWHRLPQLRGIDDALPRQIVTGQSGHRQRHVEQGLFAALRGHDDLVVLPLGRGGGGGGGTALILRQRDGGNRRRQQGARRP
jgi:hypothetical protein